ncbi:MAG: TolC family protein [Fuerstiella sp.]
MRSSIRSMLKHWTSVLKPGRAAKFLCAATVVTGSMIGCASQKASLCDRQYCDDIEGVRHYKATASSISYPNLNTQTTPAVASSIEPRNISRRIEDAPREISLTDVIQTALTQNKVIETSALGGVGAKGSLVNPATAASVYDPALQASGVLFGRRSVESALADFDTQFTSSLTFQRQDLQSPPNSLAGGGNSANFSSTLSKSFATGGSVSLNHDINYTVDPATDAATNATPNYGGRLGLQVRQPLLAGSGVGYTRIAGPSNPAFGSITGVSQGVVIARINEDVSIADFQIAVRNAIRDIESAYWDLYGAYRIFDTAVIAHESAYQTWREAKDRLDVGILKPADELQAEDRLYETKAQVETSLNQLYQAESELRRLAGMPINDGTVLRPAEEPILAEVIPDWSASITEALTNRVELRRQKWQIKSTMLQLQAAKSLVRPRLDIIAGYDINGAGDNLVNQNNTSFSSFYGSLTNQNLNSWNAGVQLDIPIGFRFTRSQVRNLELQLSKANAVLASQEKNIAHDIATSIQSVTASYAAAQSSRKRLEAAAKRVDLLETEREVGTLTLDLVLRAQASLAEAENSYYQQVVTYRKALVDLNFSTGRLLTNSGVALAEGPWCAGAYCDAEHRAHERTHAKDANHLTTAPAEFASPSPAGTVNLNQPESVPYLNMNSSETVAPSSHTLDAGQQAEEVRLDFSDPMLPAEAIEPAAVPPAVSEAASRKPNRSVRAEVPVNTSTLVEPGDRSRFQLDRSIFNNGMDKRRTAYDLDPPR